MKTANSSFEERLREIIEKNPNQFSDEVLEFIFAPSKRVRPRLIFTCLEALDIDVTQAHIDLAVAIELLHSATLIHDDIIDKSLVRRGLKTFYKKYGDKMSVILGDYLFSLSMKSLVKTRNTEVFEIFSSTMLEVCKGEIEQYFLEGKIPTIEQYIEKSRKKTALLFSLGVKCALLISGVQNEKLEDFALNY